MNRRLPVAVELAHSSWVWAVEVPRLGGPEDRGPADHHRVPDSLAMLRALATDAPGGSALQLRFATDGPSSVAAVVPLLVGRARTEEGAARLAQLAALTLPDEFGFRPVAVEALGARLIPFGLDELGAEHVVEVRRSVDAVDPTRPAVLPWPANGDPTELVGLIARSPAPTVLCIHAEHSAPTDELVAELLNTVQDLRDDLEGDPDPILQRALTAHRSWLRELPHGALQLRVTLVSSERLTPGLADLVGLAVSGAGHDGEAGYQIARPANRHELDLALQVIDGVRTGFWGARGPGDDSELRYLFGPAEAATAFRLPRHGEGTAPRSERGASSFPATRALLGRLALEHPTPFLVIDLSRGDYGPLADDLSREGSAVRRLRLDPSVRGFDPFVVAGGVGRHAHAGRLLAALDLAYGISESSPASWVLLSRAMYDAFDSALDGAPTARTLIDAADAVMTRLSLGTTGGQDLRASILGRLELLEAGPLGAVVTEGSAVDWEELLAAPTVVELGGITGPRERVLVAGFLIAGLLSHRDVAPLTPGATHVTVLGGLGPDAFATDGVAALSEGIAALIGSGEQFVLADPSPVGTVGRLSAPDGWGLPILPPNAEVPAGAVSTQVHARSAPRTDDRSSAGAEVLGVSS